MAEGEVRLDIHPVTGAVLADAEEARGLAVAVWRVGRGRVEGVEGIEKLEPMFVINDRRERLL